MKRTTLFRMLGIGAICLCMQSASAEGGYVPMLELGKSWRHNIYGAMSGTIADWTLKLDQEKEIDGQKWFVMNSYSDGVANALNPLCYLREDTTEQKVWVKMGENGDFYWSHLIASFGNAKTDYALYDFKDYSQMIATLSGGQVYHIGGFKEGDVDGYPGQVGDNLAVVQGLGLVPVGVTKDNAFFERHASSFLGLPAYHDSNDNIYPFLYAVEDGQGERIFEVPLLAAAGLEGIDVDNDAVTVSVVDRSIVIRAARSTLAEVFDAQGKKLRSLTVDSETDITGLPTGVYIVLIGGKAYKVTL